jgi:hypothetical protein
MVQGAWRGVGRRTERGVYVVNILAGVDLDSPVLLNANGKYEGIMRPKLFKFSDFLLLLQSILNFRWFSCLSQTTTICLQREYCKHASSCGLIADAIMISALGSAYPSLPMSFLHKIGQLIIYRLRTNTLPQHIP